MPEARTDELVAFARWITPHGAYRFPEEEAEIARLFVENLTRLREGRELRNRVRAPELEPAL